MPTQSFTGADLEKALKDNTLVSSSASLTGMVKTAEKQGYIQFSLTGCEGWVDLPVALIEKAEQLGNRPCKDHAHPVFRLALKESKDPLVQILTALLSESGQTSPMLLSAPAGGMFSEDIEVDSSALMLAARAPGAQGGTGQLCCKRGKSFLCGFVGQRPIYCCLEWEPCTTIGPRLGGFIG